MYGLMYGAVAGRIGALAVAGRIGALAVAGRIGYYIVVLRTRFRSASNAAVLSSKSALGRFKPH